MTIYLFSQFFEDKAIEKLNRTGINSEYLNDDKIGILMDDIYQLGKLTNTPTLRWIFQWFKVVNLLIINQWPKLVNLTEERSLILEFLPSSCQKYHLGTNNNKR